MRDADRWALIERARQMAAHHAAPEAPATGGPPDAEDVARALTALLAGRTPEEIIGFAQWQQRLDDESYRYDLWGAAYLINGGCSIDGFDHFRGWLLAQGERVWRSALADPDGLAGYPEVLSLAPGGERQFDVLGCENMLTAAHAAYTTATARAAADGTADDDAALDAFYQAVVERGPDGPPGDGPAGEEWELDDEEEARRRLPRLHRLFWPE